MKNDHQNDAEKAPSYIYGLGKKDASFYCKYFVDVDNYMANIFCCNSISRPDYRLFSDIVVIDSTYKKKMLTICLWLFSLVLIIIIELLCSFLDYFNMK